MGRTDFELQNFALLLNEEVKSLINEQGDSGFRETAFTQVAMDHLVNGQETSNVQTCTCIHRNAAGNRLRQLNGYALWDGYETLDLFIADFRGEGSIYTLEKNRLTSAFNQLARYFAFALKGDYENLEESAEEQEFLQNFDYFNEELLRVRFILITDGIVKSEPPTIKPPNKELTLIQEIWDLERLYQLWTSQRKREPIELNITTQFNYSIPVLSSEQENGKYETYLAVIPGNLLADLYDVYGSRLLEQNVRVFLQNLGKVNKGIRKTILESPEMFLAYNNGISATATELDMTSNPDQMVLSRIKGLQIVNGGQTTSSIYYARKKDRANLENVLVQMKITVIPDSDRLEQMVSSISRYANSQNRVSEVDLTSNQTMHILLEELSRTTWAPAHGSSSYQTRWYYERVKGQYKEELNKEHTKSRRLNFKKRNPINQVVRKEQLAKYYQAWLLMPHWVVRGSQKNYLNFMTDVERLEPDRIFFRKIIAKAILFRTGERLYGKKPNAMGDLRYLVVPYAIAWLNYMTTDSIDLEHIWERQGGSNELENLLKQILLKTNSFFQQEKPEEYALVSEWAKKEDCWTKLKRKSPSDWEIDLSRIKSDLITNKPDNIFSNDMDKKKRTELEHVNVENWEKIEQFGVETKLLEPFQISLIRNIVRRLKKQQPLTESMVEHGSSILFSWQKANKN